MNIYAVWCIFPLLMFSFAVQAGVVIGGTRFIYPEAADSISFEVKNTSSDTYLVNTKITQESGSAPFIATPPLFPISPGDANKIRIVRTGGSLPTIVKAYSICISPRSPQEKRPQTAYRLR